MTAMTERPYTIFHPLNFIALSFFFGVFGRTLFILGSDSPSVGFLLDYRDVTTLYSGAVLSMIGSILLCVGWLVGRPFELSLHWLGRWFGAWRRRGFLTWSPVLWIVAAIATVLFLRATGFTFTTLTELSAKRRVETDGSLQAALGYHRLIGQELPKVALLMFIAMWSQGFKRAGVLVGIAAFGLLAIALPFLASSRAGVLMSLIAICVVLDMTRGLKIRTLALALVVSVTIIFGMLALRRVNTRGSTFSAAIVELGFEPLFGNRNFADITKLSHVYEGVPSQIDYKYGSSYLNILYAPVPRTVWPDKPAISMGYELTQKLYNRDAGRELKGGGTPPGIFAESVVNFGIFGLPVIAFIGGVWLRLLHNTLLLQADTSTCGVVLYATVLPAYCLMLMSGDFTRGLIIILANTALVMFVALLGRFQLNLR